MKDLRSASLQAIILLEAVRFSLEIPMPPTSTGLATLQNPDTQLAIIR